MATMMSEFPFPPLFVDAFPTYLPPATPPPPPIPQLQPRDLLFHVIKSWVSSPADFLLPLESLQMVHDRINSFIDTVLAVLSSFNISNYMIFPVVIYAQRYVLRQGVQYDQLFHLLLASTMSTIKYWEDTATGVNKTIAASFNYSLESVNHVERSFLNAIQWDLTLDWDEVEHFALQITDYLTSIQISNIQSSYLYYPPEQGQVSNVPYVYCYVVN